MKITALGHSCVLLDLAHAGGRTRILVDPWLSDHATGDAMGRFPRLRFDVSVLEPLDAIFLSHAHCDHLDPYTLVRLYRELAEPPALLLPISLAFLKPLFAAHLPNATLVFLEPWVPMAFAGLELLGLYDIGQAPTNEEDVMVLVVRGPTEAVLVEADAQLSLEAPEFREGIRDLLCAPGVTNAVFLTTENELSGTLGSRICTTLDEREDLVEQAVDELLDAVHHLFQPVDDPDDLWNTPHLLRLVHGQGLAAPHDLDPRWQQILFPVRIARRVREERAAADWAGFSVGIDSLVVGSVHTVEGGQLVGCEPLADLTLLDEESARTYRPDLPFFPALPLAPFRPGVRDVDAQRARVRDLLHHRFLPYLHGLRLPSVLHLLAADSVYRIRVHHHDGPRDHVLSFEDPRFVEGHATDAPAHETYWANDLEDFLDGRADEFTTFCRQPFPGVMRLWACLATPLLHPDLVTRRIAVHFERARRGLTPGSYLTELLALID